MLMLGLNEAIDQFAMAVFIGDVLRREDGYILRRTL